MSQTYQQEADQVLLNLNKANVTTGILYDRVFPLANLHKFQGLSTDDTTNTEHFHQAYYELYNAMINNGSYQTPEALNNYLKTNYLGNEHTIGLMLFNYNYLDTNAIKNNQLYSINSQLYDDPNRTTSPWLQNTFFVASPLLPAESILKQGEHTFTIDPNLILSNTAFNISTITVNFDDGFGDQQLYNNNGASGGMQTNSIFSKVARFLASKIYLVRLTVVLTNGQTYRSLSKVISKKDNPIKTIIDGCNGGDVINITGNPINASQYGGGLEHAEGKAYIFYSNANCGTGKISKPIIFLDGFDPANDRDVQKIYDEFVNKNITFKGVDVKLGDKLRADGYDIIVYDYKDGGDLIEKNALAVVSLLQQLQYNFGTNIKNDYVLIGPSMGALVGQYALAYAEANQIPTHTRLFISFDGPHQGANAPIGIQNLTDYLFQKGITSLVFKKLKDGIHRVPSAKQMLVHHSTVNSEIPAANNFRTIFLNNLQAVNNYPTQLRKVAIINGSNNLSPNEYLQTSNEILNIRVKRAGLLGLANGKLGDRLNINIQASPSSGTIATSDVWLFSPLLNLFLWRSPSFIKNTAPTINNFSYDKAIGSNFTDPVDERTDAWINVGQTLLYLFAGNESTFRHNINPTFIPTTSAIDLQTSTFSLAYDFSNENIVCSGRTPFDRVYAPTSNQPHVQITSENAEWFDNEIKQQNITPQPGLIVNSNSQISGPVQFCTSESYSISNKPAGSSVSWSILPTTGIANLTTSGNIATLTKTGDGNVQLIATISGFCGNFTLVKNIHTTPIITNFRYTGSNPGNPITGESLSFEVDPVPEAVSYTWYNNNEFLATTTEPYYSTFNWSCGDHRIYVQASTSSCGSSDLGGGEYYWGSCTNSYSYAIYPNPADDMLTIKPKPIKEDKIKVRKEITANLYNEKGEKLKTGESINSGETITFDTRNIPNGTYYLHIIEGKETIKKQVIIKH